MRAVEKRYRTHTIFISGSAHEFGPWRPDDAGRFLELLSADLIANGLNIVTGFGLGVGPSVIAGALQRILAHPTRHSRNQLQAFPFPVDDGSVPTRRAMYRRHREAMISNAGIAIFVFGNKRDDRGKIILADGMRYELETARSMGLQIIAIGSTGWIAQEIAAELRSSLSGRTKAFLKAFTIANDPNVAIESIVRATLTMACEYRDDSTTTINSFGSF